MRATVSIASVVLAVVAGLSGLRRQTTEAATLYAQNCAACHGLTGVPNAAMASSLGIPDFTDPRGVTAKPDAVLQASVTAGKGKMPAINGRLTPAQVRLLVTYVKSLSRQRHR